MRRALSILALLALVASAAFGGDLFGVRERVFGSVTPRPVAVSRATSAPAPVRAPQATTQPVETVLRSQPWWQTVTTLKGTGTMTPPPVTIAEGALQWRVTWTCGSGQLVVRSSARPTRPLVSAGCPGTGTGYGTQTGPVRLSITDGGPWQLKVDQEVDVPLEEPPLATMTAPGASMAATGTLYRIDQVGTGTITFYRLADGSYALRLDKFFVTANVDLEIRLTPLAAPHSTEQYLAAPSVLVAPLDITVGSLNFAVPAGVDPTQYRSVVIWCPLITSAYAASSLSGT